jgi:cytochrome c oxidase subunit 2
MEKYTQDFLRRMREFALLIILCLVLLPIDLLQFPCALSDAADPLQLGFQDAATPMMQGIIDLHHDIFFFLILILVFVSRILVRALWHFNYKKNPIPQRIVHGTTIEILRTIFPSIIPMFIAIPSFALLYSMDEVVVDPAMTIKAIGHQWYRTYEYSDYNSSDEQSLTFDSYTIPEDDLELGQSRLLEVDNRVVVPAKTHLRIIVTSADVPRSWATTSLSVGGEHASASPGWTSILGSSSGEILGSSEGGSEGTVSSVNQPQASEGGSEGTVSSVNQPQAPAAEAPAPYPFPRNYFFGGDSVESIQRRLLGRVPHPSDHDISMAQIDAQDLFQVKVAICQIMAVLNPSGDWAGRGALALENPRTVTGEDSLENLLRILDGLRTKRSRSPDFLRLLEKVPLRRG